MEQCIAKLGEVWEHARFPEPMVLPLGAEGDSSPGDLNRTIMDLLPDRIFVKDTGGRYLVFNRAASEYWSVPQQEAMGRTDEEIFPAAIAEAFRRSDRMVFETGRPIVIEERLEDGRGIERVLAIIKIPLKTPAGDFWGLMGISRDITDLRRYQESLRRRDAILEAVNRAAGSFLREGFQISTLRDVLRSLGAAAEVSRVYVFVNRRRADGVLVTSQLAEWAAPGISSQAANPVLVDFPWEEGGMGRWVAFMEKGECVQGNVRDFPASEQKILRPQSILSLVAAPILVDRRWWGFIGFDECCREREWAAGEVEALKASANLVAAAVQQSQARAELLKFRDYLQVLVHERTEELEKANLELSHEVETRRATEEKLSMRAAELAALNRLGRKVNATLAHETVAESAVEEIQKALMPDAVVFLLRRGRFLLPLAVSPRVFSIHGEPVSLRTVGECLCGEAAATGEPVYSLDVLNDPRCSCSHFKSGEFHSVASIPLVSEEEVLGVLTVASKAKRDFRDEEQFIQAFSNQVSVGLRNALLYEQLQWHVKELQRGFHELKRAQEIREELEAQLRQIQKMEAIGTLAGGIAHEFNNLLQSVQGYAELMLMGKDSDSRDYQRLKAICRAAARGGELTHQLLTYSRKSESNLRPVDLNEEIRETHRILQRTLPKMIDIRLELTEGLPAVQADPQQIEQVLINLALNARDAMPQGGTLTIATEKWAASGDEPPQPALLSGEFVRLRVSDTGHGMESSTLSRIFDPFFTTKEVGRGTGLGLAIVYGIVQNHAGTITCDSKPGQGTSFEIYLPVAGHEAKKAPSEPEPEVIGGRETILLIDDEDFLRSLGEQVLGLYGYTVITAADADAAIAIYEKQHGRIDLVILDLIMPGKSGYQCMERLLEINPDARIIVASGYVEMEGWGSELLSHARFVVRKPYEMRDLLHLMRKALDESV